MNISRVGAQIGRVPSEAVEEPDPQFVGDRRYENIGTRRRRRSKDEAEIEAELVPSHPQQQRLNCKRPPKALLAGLLLGRLLLELSKRRRSVRPRPRGEHACLPAAADAGAGRLRARGL